MNATVQRKDRNVNDRPQPEQYQVPEANIFEIKDGYVLELEMPGVSKDGLEVTLENNEVTITGRRDPETTPGVALLCERTRADFRRVFELDPAIDTSKVTARMDQGVLTLTLPKSERVKPRRITIS